MSCPGKMADFDPCKSSDEDRDSDSDSGNTSEEDMSDEVRCKKSNKSGKTSDKPDPDKPNAEPGTESILKKVLLRRVLPCAALGVTAVIAAPFALGAIGFGAGGIVGGSWAAGMMSSAAIANGGGVVAGSVVAVLQSAGAAGVSAAANVGIFTAVTTATAGVAEAGSRIQNKIQEKLSDDKPDNVM
ncbi:interferon alpha-inducible protein 27-like protein 2B [Mercenaria mercenaria]|uniref:interferon alpha-inducible protein 27-like protein 2B n=1 Tax=Mercenaria mercenaria TaxID=6596 RepID=UPI00234FB2D0|nr:interferon alpha-inducible protein 27-like protein 2B [Mercenaria mercenaria]